VGVEHAVRKKLADFLLRPPVDDGVNDLVQVRAGVDVVRDAGRDDGEDVGGAMAAFVEPGE
jgi:hypothetical protein